MASPIEIELLESALAIPDPGDRCRFLESACAGNVPLRLEVERLLDVHLAADLFFEEASPDFPDSTPSPIGLAPTEVGNYRLLSKLGEGGWGVVYRAVQDRPVRREVAVKVIKLGMDTRAVVARFEAERQALALMDHPNIARVLDAGSTENGRPFFVMELVAGIRITEFCNQQRLSVDRRIDLFLQVCHGVQHAHQKGVIHRDLKPSNILVAVHDNIPQAKIIDFGIAKATGGAQLSEQTAVTELHQAIGTPAYMSPEQSGCGPGDVDTRSDIYSLGVILFELLVGQTPVSPTIPSSVLQQQRRSTSLDDEPVSPSTSLTRMSLERRQLQAEMRQLTSERLLTTLRGDLDWVVLRCLAQEPARRYQTVKELSQDLERYLGHEPVAARPPTRVYRLRKLYARHRLFFLSASGFAVILLLASATSTWMYLRERSARQSAHVEALRSATVAQFLEQMFTGLRPSNSRGRDTSLLREILERAAQRMTHDLKDQPDVEAELRATLGKAYEEVGFLDRSIEEHRRALQLRRLHFGPDHRLVASSLNDLSGVLYATGQFEEAETNILATLKLARTLGGEEDPLAVDALSRLSVLRSRRGRTTEAVVLARQVVAVRRQQASTNRVEFARALVNLAFVLNQPDQLVEAEQLTREALDIERREYPGGDPRMIVTLTNLGEADADLGRFEDAEKFTREAIDLGIKFNGKCHPTTFWGHEVLARIFRLQHRWNELVQQRRLIFELAVEQSLSVAIDNDVTLERVVRDDATAGRGDLLDELLADLLSRPNLQDVDRGYILAARGSWEARQGLWDQAIATLTQAIHFDSHNITATSDLALLFADQGRVSEYQQWVDRYSDQWEPTESGTLISREVYRTLLLPSLSRPSPAWTAWMEKACNLDPIQVEQPLIEWTMGFLRYRLGEFKVAEEISQKILAESVSTLEQRILANLLLAGTRNRLGSREEARRLLDEAERQWAGVSNPGRDNNTDFDWRTHRLISIFMRELRQDFAVDPVAGHQSSP